MDDYMKKYLEDMPDTDFSIEDILNEVQSKKAAEAAAPAEEAGESAPQTPDPAPADGQAASPAAPETPRAQTETPAAPEAPAPDAEEEAEAGFFARMFRDAERRKKAAAAQAAEDEREAFPLTSRAPQAFGEAPDAAAQARSASQESAAPADAAHQPEAAPLAAAPADPAAVQAEVAAPFAGAGPVLSQPVATPPEEEIAAAPPAASSIPPETPPVAAEENRPDAAPAVGETASPATAELDAAPLDAPEPPADAAPDEADAPPRRTAADFDLAALLGETPASPADRTEQAPAAAAVSGATAQSGRAPADGTPRAGGGHELWLGLTDEPETAAASPREFPTDEYEPGEFSALDAGDFDHIRTGVAAQKRRRAALGTENVVNDQDPTQVFAQEEAEADDGVLEFREEADAEAVEAHYRKAQRHGLVRMLLSAVLAAPLIYLGLAPDNGWPIPGLFTPEVFPRRFLAVTLALTLLVLLVSLRPLARGVKHIFAGAPDANSLLALSALACLVPQVYCLLARVPAGGEGYQVMSGAVAVGLAASGFGALLDATRKKRGFHRIRFSADKRVLLPIEDDGLCQDLLGGANVGGSVVFHPVQTGFVDGYVRHADAPDISRVCARVLSWIVLAFAVLLFAATFFMHHSVPAAMMAACYLLLIAAPFTAQVVFPLPALVTAGHLARYGSMVVGMDGVRALSDVGGLVIDSKHLFPKNAITLHGIRTFGSYHIDDAIIDAASVVCAAGGALSNVFLGVIDNNKRVLRAVDSLTYEDGLGLSAWVADRRVLVGAADLLRNHGVDVPSRDYESRYLRDGRSLVYVSVAGELTAMFVVSYHALPEIADKLSALRRNRIGLVVVNRDCNITPEVIAQLFDFPLKLIRILPPASEHLLGRGRLDRAPAQLIYSKGILGMAESVVSSLRLGTAVRLANAVQIGGAVLGCMMIVLMALNNSLVHFTVSELLIWQVVWSALTLAVSLFRAP